MMIGKQATATRKTTQPETSPITIAATAVMGKVIQRKSNIIMLRIHQPHEERYRYRRTR